MNANPFSYMGSNCRPVASAWLHAAMPCDYWLKSVPWKSYNTDECHIWIQMSANLMY